MRKKSFKSALTVLLSLMMILVMFPANAFAMDGEGTKENPYEIATASELYEFAIKVNEGNNTACAVLTADITLPIDTNWTPIGKENACMYEGTFDGDGHTITGLKVDIQSDNIIYAGLFGCLGAGGTIKNVSLTDSKITCSGNRVSVGGVCGLNDYGTIENCYNTGEVSGTGTSTDGSGYAGGVCGWNTGTIENCYFLFGTTDNAVGNSTGTVNRVEEKSAEAFASGEVAWLLNEPQTEKPWGQGSNGMPVLKGNLPDGVTSYVPVRITIVMQDNSEQYRYTTEGNTVAEYPTGYAFFFKDGDTKTWISKGTQTYDADATIYAENMPLEKIQAKAPTCTENGNSAYWYSAAFDKYFKDENGVNEITAESTVIPAKGHGESEVKGAKEATCTEDGYTGDKVCKVCGEILERGTVIEKLGHVWGEPEWNWSEDGASCKVTFTCKNNPEHKETPEADVTSEVKTPATCTEAGVTTYTATFEFNGKTYTDTKDVADLAATGHELQKTDAKEATCTEDGNIEYWFCETCGKYFSNENAETEIQLADTVMEATGHSYDNGICTICGEIDPDFKAVIIEGANGEWQKGTKDGLSFTSNAAFAHFQKVQVDGKDLDAFNYTVKEGSTIVTLKAEYLETLSAGRHTLAIVSDTGTAAAEFTIEAASADDNTTVVPPTGDNSNVDLWIALMLVSVCGISMATVYSRRKKYNH